MFLYARFGEFLNIKSIKQISLFSNHYKSAFQITKAPSRNFSYKWNTREDDKRFSTIPNVNPNPGSNHLTTEDHIQQFLSIFPDIVTDFTETIWDDDFSNFQHYFKKMLRHVFQYHTFGIGHSLAASYNMLAPLNNQTSESLRLANILGWCTEMLYFAIAIGDDIRDGAKNRIGVLCWHQYNDVGLRAIIDAQVVENGIYLVIKKYFSGHQCYLPIIELFHKVVINVMMGQTLDEMYNIESGRPLLELFTTDRFETLVRYKTAPMSVLPVRLAMYLADIKDNGLHKEANEISLRLGYLWQLDNDILDCYADPVFYGKESTDINNGKCTWLAVKALQKASPEQRRIMELNYGKSLPECERAIKNLYQELDIFNEYVVYKKRYLKLVRKDADQLQSETLKTLFYKMSKLPEKTSAMFTG